MLTELETNTYFKSFSHRGREINIKKFSLSKQGLNHEARRRNEVGPKCIFTLKWLTDVFYHISTL